MSDAYLLLGERHYKAVVLGYGDAIQRAVEHRATYYELIRADSVLEMLRAADSQGYEHGYAQGRLDELHSHQ